MNPSQNSPDPQNKNNRKTIINLIYLFVLVAVIISAFALNGNKNEDQSKNKEQYSELIGYLKDGKVSELEVSENKDKITAKIYTNNDNKKRNEVETKTYPSLYSGDDRTSVLESLNIALGDKKIDIGNPKDMGKVVYSQKEKQWYEKFWDVFFQNFFFFFLILGVGMYLVKKIGDTNNRTISFGNTRAKMYDDDLKEKITFADVAGNEEAKQELTEVVDFLKRPEDYTKMGAKIPRGVLLVGSPGNGKTLMAKAIAGEANVPFLYVSGSEFVEMFVGVGAGRVRDLFKKAKKKSPCVIFIDEIDAVGRQRGAGLGGGNDEREQTLNQILVEMDGFETNTYVILIGATNRPDVLDPALLRPGRFDRQVVVTAPDKKEREQILQVHARNKKMAKDADLATIARRTAGFSGADLMNVLNEAAILTVRQKEPEITNNTLREAIEKVILGPSLKSKVITDEQKKLTAFHEAGHALVQTVLPKASKVQKITIIPRGRAAGYTFADNGDNDPMTRSKSQFMADITSLFGGYVTEEIVFGEVSTGASNDLSKATETARDMVTRYGMSDIGPISFEKDKGLTFLGRDMVENKHYSEATARQVDIEIEKILHTCYEQCKKIITTYRYHLDKIADSLLEKETLEYEEFSDIVVDVMNVGI
jgi:cell division protease FtsH